MECMRTHGPKKWLNKNVKDEHNTCMILLGVLLDTLNCVFSNITERHGCFELFVISYVIACKASIHM